MKEKLFTVNGSDSKSMDLKCCPFCGKIPDHYYSENDKGYVIECSCSARVISYVDDNHKDSRYFDEFNDLEDIDITKIRAVDQWNSRSKEPNNWIITEDTLPKDDRQVLCLHMGAKPIYSIGYFHMEWLSDVGTHPFEYFQYWMKLPDCPEEQ